MTPFEDLLLRLQRLDIRLALDGERVTINAPKDAVTPELRTEMAGFKAEIRAHLQGKVIASRPRQASDRTQPTSPSHMQQRLWFIKQMDPASIVYNVPATLRMTGRLDDLALERALDDIVRRHDSLRTRFLTVDGAPYCVVDADVRATLERADVSMLPPGDREQAAMAIVKALAQRPFDISRAPLLHAVLIRVAPDQHLFSFVLDHIIADGLSIGILMLDFHALYTRHVGGVAPALPILPMQYLDYVEWERDAFARGALDEHRSYWKAKLSGLPALLQLPTDHPRPPVQSHAGSRITMQLPPGLAQRLKAFARGESATLFMVLLSAFQVLLHRYSRETDLAIGSAIANRNRSEVERVIGFFANNIVLRGDLSGNPSVRELVARTRTMSLDAYAHQEMPLDLLVDALAVQRQPGHTPLFQVMFVLHNLNLSGFDLPQLKCEPVDQEVTTARFDLSVDVFDLPQGLRVYFEYCTELFEAATIERMAGQFERLLEGFIAVPDAPIGSVPILSDAGSNLILREWNRTSVAPPATHELHALFEAQVARRPDATAVRCASAALTYGELNAQSNRLGRHLRTLGVGAGSLVGVCVERSLELVVALLAVQKAGGAYVPLDPGFPADRLDYMLSDSGARVLVTAGDAAASMTVPAGVRVVDLAVQRSALEAQAATNLEVVNEPSDPAYVIYTSGSTGLPKGVVVPHGALSNFLDSMAREPGLGASDVLAAVTTISFDIAGLELYLPLVVGARIELLSREVAMDGEALSKALAESGATVLQATPATWRMLVESGWRPVRPLRAFCGGEALPRELADALLERVSELWNLYGPTETTIWSTVSRVVAAPEPITVGHPIANTRIYVLDEQRRPTGIGVPGEIWIGGAGVATGYHERAELTSERFVADPFAGEVGARMYRTGDLGRWDARGRLHHMGRLDNQVKIRGYRIELGEIEAVLATHASVRQAVVQPWQAGAGDVRLVAYIVPSEEGALPEVAALRAHLGQKLPEYMIPATVVALVALPLTPNGKIDRKALPAPDLGGQRSSATAVHPMQGHGDAPLNPTEQALAQIWREVLVVDSVGRNDNFFALGGHSLLAVRVVSRVRDRFQVELSLREFFQAPLLEAMAQRVDSKTEVATVATPPASISGIQVAGSAPLSYAQERMWLLHRLAPQSPAYNIACAITLRGHLDVGCLRRALESLELRHEGLRTCYRFIDDEVIQQVSAANTAQLEVLARGDEQAGPGELLELARSFAARPFDLENGPVMRSALLRTAENEHLLAIVVHHVAADRWALGIIGRDLAEYYDAYVAGRQPVLSPVAVNGRQYAVWQREWLDGERMSGLLEFWRARLEGLRPLELPSDRARPSILSDRGRQHATSLPGPLVAALRRVAAKEGATLFMMLVATFAALLARRSGQSDFAIATPVANRNSSEVEGLVGSLVNTVVMRFDLSGGPTFHDFLQRVRETALEALAHQDAPFEKVVEQAGVERDPGRAPLAQVMFNMQDGRLDDLRFTGLTWEARPLDLGSAQFELSLSVDPDVTQALYFEYNADLFDAETIERMAGQYRKLLEGIVEDASQRISEMELLTTAERGQVLEGWNATRDAASGKEGWLRRFEIQADRHAEAEALRFQGRSLTYGELNAQSNRLGRHLRTLGVGAGSLVGVCVERSLELVVALLAVQKAGGAYVPLDPGFPADRLDYMLSDSGARVLVTAGDAAASMTVPAGVRVVDLAVQRSALEAQAATNLEVVNEPSDPAYVIYTSGSTGLPKGVVVPHGALSNFLDSMAREPGLGASDVLAAVTTISFDIAGLELYLPLVVGARIELLSREVAMDGEALSKALAESGATVLQATPATWRMLVESGWRPVRPLRAFCGGEALPRELADALLERVSELWNLYGPTETTIWSTVSRVVAAPEPITVGHPIANTRIYVLDEQRRPTGIGVPGEIWIGGAGVATGYHERAELTSERFVADPFAGEVGARMYRTGDLGRWDARGRLHHMGRLDNQVKIRGYRIELGEIEAVLATHASVRQAVVQPWQAGAGDVRLVAYIVPSEEGALPEVAALRAHLGQKLPEYMIPATVVALVALPLTPNGKIDRKALPAPDLGAASAATPEIVAPRTDTELALAAIWREVLQLPAIGIDDHFFARGGHSLLVARVASRIRARFSIDVPLRTLFDLPTIRELARRLDELSGGDRRVEVIPVARRPERPPLSFAQQRLWYFDQLTPGSALFNLPIVLKLTGTLDRAALEAAFRAVLARHESLRTVLAVDDGEPYQLVCAESPARIETGADDGNAGTDSSGGHHAAIRDEVALPFDVARGPLVRARLFRVDERQHVLAVTLHHAIADGVSVAIFVRDWAECYRAEVMREPARLEPLPIQYVDYAIWQRASMSGARLDEQIDYWRAALADAPPRLDLPLDRPRPAMQTYRGALCQRKLDAALRARLEALARRANASMFMAMFAAFVHLLQRHSGQDDVSVGIAVAGRGATETENLVGLFINTLVLRTRLQPQASFEQLLDAVRGTSLDAFAHQDLPFERLVEALRPPRDLSRTPLFQVLFNMLDAGVPASRSLPGIDVAPYVDDLPVQLQAKFDLTLYVEEHAGSLMLSAVYNADLFAPERIADLLDQYLALLAAASVAPSKALGGLALPTARAAACLPDPAAPLQQDWLGTVQARFSAHAQREPARIAVQDATASLSYGELDALANRLAQHLLAAGVGREDRVAILAERNAGIAWALLGVLKAGAAFVLLDAAYPAERQLAMLAIARPKAWIDLTSDGPPEPVEDWLTRDSQLVLVGWQARGGAVAARWRDASPQAPPERCAPDDLAYLVFTSGSTGVPKAIAGTHAPLSHFFDWHQQAWGLGAADRFSVLSGLSHDPMLRDVLGALWAGATVVFPDADVFAAPEDLLRWLAREAVTVVHLTPAMADVVTIGSDPAIAALPCLRHVFFGGDALTLATVAALRGLAPAARFVNYYGASETPQAMGFHEVMIDAGAEALPRLPLGRGIPGVQLLVLNPAGQPAAVGELGEIVIRTPYLARGYFDDPAMTAARFVTNPFTGVAADRMYRTGDLGRHRPDGSVEFAGRRDHQVKIRGFRVELAEVEAALATNDEVTSSVVVAREIATGDRRLVAYVVLRANSGLTVTDVRRYLRRRLPDHMVPSIVVALDSLPLTRNGKVDRGALPDPYREAQRGAVQNEPLTSGMEQALADIWKDILNLERVGPADNFFDLGGHSLLSLRAAARIEQLTGWRMDPRSLFFMNLRQLAALAQAAKAAG